MQMILAVMGAISAAARERPEKFRPKRDSNPDLCNTGAVLLNFSGIFLATA